MGQTWSVGRSEPDVMTTRLVGRDLELGALARFLGDQSPAACLVLSGEAGIGKTALWEAGREMAAREGFQVLSSRASQAEAGLSFAGLADLVDGIDPAVLARIPAPQVHALDVAMRRVAPDATPPDPFATAAGFLSTVRELGSGGRPLIAVDDAQWLDSSSADCLLFLARRVTGRQTLFLLSGRTGER